MCRSTRLSLRDGAEFRDRVSPSLCRRLSSHGHKSNRPELRSRSEAADVTDSNTAAVTGPGSSSSGMDECHESRVLPRFPLALMPDFDDSQIPLDKVSSVNDIIILMNA